jgi:Ankyrin repeats (3 copies)
MYPNPAEVIPLPSRPNLEQYKKQAKDLVKACRSGEPDGIRQWAMEWIETLISLHAPTVTSNLTFQGNRRAWFDRQSQQVEEFARNKLSNVELRPKCALTDAQFVIARVHGFKSWSRFAKHVEGLSRATSSLSKFESAVEAVIAGDVLLLEKLLSENPELIHARSTREHQATLLQYLSANGVESFRQTIPKNAVQIVKILLKAGAEVDAPNWPDGPAGPGTALGEVATSIHAQRAGLQDALLATLLSHGASIDGLPGGWNPLLAALHNDRPEAAEFLASHGAHLDLEGAAGVGRLDVVTGFFNNDGSLKPNATRVQLQSGFISACEYGRKNVVEFLLDKGVDLRVGENTGQTALHLAAHRGQLEIIRLLFDRGAALEAKNVYGGTVLGQATWSVMHGEPSVDFGPTIEALLNAGAKIGEADYPTGNAAVDALLRRHGAKSK